MANVSAPTPLRATSEKQSELSPPPPSAIGAGLPRVDGVAKVTGRARYVDDLPTQNAWYGVTVRSKVAHAVLNAITVPPAFAALGAVLVTAADIASWGWRNVIALIEYDQPALVPVGGRMMHVDEPVALVAAPTAAAARAAAALIGLEVTPLPPVLSIDAALAAETVLYGQDNVFKQFVIRKGHADDAALADAFASAHRIIEGEYHTSPQEQMYIEPQGMLAHWEATTCHVVGSLQCPYYVHKALKAMLGLADEQIVVGQAVTGGGFGGKEEYPSMIAAHAVLLARKAAHPVKLIYERREDIAATTKRHPARIRHRLALAANGDIIAMDVDVVMDGGAYLTLSPVVLSRGVLHAAGPYKAPVVKVRGRVVATNYPPHGAFRGFGAPQTTFAYERQMQKAARAFGVDPLAYRSRLALRSGDRTATDQELTFSVGTDAVLTAIAQAAGHPPERVGYNRHGAPVRRGRGVCFYFHGAGFTGSGEARLAGRAAVALTAAGRFEVRSASTDIGQGVITMFTQIATTALGVSPELVTVVDPSTDRVPDSGPTVASRTCMVVGSVVDQAARAVGRRVRAWAAAHGLADADMATAAAAMARAEGEIAELVQYAPPPGIVWDDATYSGSAYPVYGWAACLVDVEVDLDSYETTILRCVHAVDVGKAINPIIVKGQIEGGTLQALGWALWENVLYKDGKVINANMTNCIVPTFADAPELETILVEEPYPYGPAGAKGVGEIPMDGPAAAVANAVEDAMDCPFDRLPVSPEAVMAAVAARSAV